jgi:hypothetical protein
MEDASLTLCALMVLACSGADVIVKIQLPDKSNAPTHYSAPLIPALIQLTLWKLFNWCCRVIVGIECVWVICTMNPNTIEMSLNVISIMSLIAVAILALTLALRTSVQGLWVMTASLLLSIQCLAITVWTLNEHSLMQLLIAWVFCAMVVVALQERNSIPKTEVIRDWMFYLHLPLLFSKESVSFTTVQVAPSVLEDFLGLAGFGNPARGLSLLLLVPCVLATLKARTRPFETRPDEDESEVAIQ